MNDITVWGDPIQWEGEGQFGKNMLDFSNFDAWFNMTAIEFKNVVDRYEQAMGNDGKIDIMEKKDIIKELDEYMNCLLALRFNLYPDKPTWAAENDEYGYIFKFSKEADKWTGEGEFTKHLHVDMSKFSAWYEKVMLKKFNEFSEKYKEIVADGIIEEHESDEMHPIVDHFIFEILVVRNFLDKGLWKE